MPNSNWSKQKKEFVRERATRTRASRTEHYYLPHFSSFSHLCLFACKHHFSPTTQAFSMGPEPQNHNLATLRQCHRFFFLVSKYVSLRERFWSTLLGLCSHLLDPLPSPREWGYWDWPGMYNMPTPAVTGTWAVRGRGTWNLAGKTKTKSCHCL